MASLNGMKDDLPEELASTVDELTTTLEAVEDPDTSPQDRQGVIDSARQLTTALTTITDDGTPDELREQLTTLVKQTSSTLQISQDPQVPPEEQSLVIVVVKRSTSAVKKICDPETPQEQRDQQIPTMRNLYHALRAGRGEPQVGARALEGSTGLATAARSATPQELSGELTETAYRQSKSLRKFTDSKSSPEDRARAEKDMGDQGARMGEEQKDAAPTQDAQEASLAQEATVCTNAIFESVPQHRLAKRLKSIVPDNWDTEGVKDFWKAKEKKEKEDEFLDVLAQLRNDEHVHAPVEIAQLISELAELVPNDRLFATLGTPASQCEQTASDLDEGYDVEVGNWLVEAGGE